MNAEMPLLPLALSVTAITTMVSPDAPCVMNILLPLSTQRSPFHSALVRMLSESEPDPGSVSAQAPSIRPDASSGRYFRRSASDPNAWIWAVQRELWEATVSPREPSPFEISSNAIA
jgi:hypothetical protein